MTNITLLITALLSVFFLTLLVLYIWSITWSFKDANSRGKNGFIVAVLVAFFAWPFAFLFWHVVRPEDIKIKAKPAKSKKSSTYTNKYMANFKEMPSLLKVLLIINIFTTISTFFNLIQIKPVEFEYFGLGFPKNYPVIWYSYYLMFSLITIFVYFKRSYLLLKKYLYFTIGMLLIAVANSAYFIANLPLDQRITATYTYLFTYIIGGLIPLYLFNQKGYFNKE